MIIGYDIILNESTDVGDLTQRDLKGRCKCNPVRAKRQEMLEGSQSPVKGHSSVVADREKGWLDKKKKRERKAKRKRKEKIVRKKKRRYGLGSSTMLPACQIFPYVLARGSTILTIWFLAQSFQRSFIQGGTFFLRRDGRGGRRKKMDCRRWPLPPSHLLATVMGEGNQRPRMVVEHVIDGSCPSIKEEAELKGRGYPLMLQK
ncbi:hypothetical protein TNIN_247221 [Trichonephila inaurata madagascariensis]|uniref:Uncharacterized protein n=1 Tax=Trichonephila inaurata madagascariensis TaxID=2747483 RepID=A0A8X6YHN1_9ARAC|nr:hypothetical protein TNIN_247221 [Trichonephila inaurata madagascariensis]